MAAEIIRYAAVVLVWAALLDYAVASWRRPGEVVAAATLRAVLCVAVMFTLLMPPVYTAIDDILGVPNISRLLADYMLVLLAWALQPILAHFSDPEGRRGKVVNAPSVLLVLLVMTILFALAPVDRTEPRNFAVAFAGRPWVLEYTLAAMLLPALTAGRFLLVAYPLSREVSDPTLRRRQYLQTLGWAFGLAYTLHQCLVAAMGDLGLSYQVLDPAVMADVLKGGCALFLLSGELFNLHTWLLHRRAYRELYPLWAMFYDPSRQDRIRDALRVSGITSRLEDRRMQIYDAVVLLQPYIDSSVLECARQYTRARVAADDAEAHAVAATLTAAIQARKQGQPACSSPRESLLAAEDELGFLLRVSGALRHPSALAACERATAIAGQPS